MTHGMVCAPQHEAVEAGALALRNGGNAVDAAVSEVAMAMAQMPTRALGDVASATMKACGELSFDRSAYRIDSLGGPFGQE